jgi:ABC-type sugar transport system ATPase subunit
MRDGQVVANLLRSEVDRDALVRHILGRELQSVAPVTAAPRGEILVRCVNLSCGDDLREANFDVGRGEIVGFFGLLGSGYGAIGEALYGLSEAHADSLRIGGLDHLPSGPAEAIAKGIGYVPADRKRDGLILRATIQENLILPSIKDVCWFNLIDRKKAMTRSERLVKIFDIRCASVMQQAGDLSGGNQQKIVIAKWQPTGARVLIMDEPTRGVDVGAKAEIYHQLRDFVRGDAACIILSSDVEEIVKVCDRAYVLKRGRIVTELSGAAVSISSLTESAL